MRVENNCNFSTKNSITTDRTNIRFNNYKSKPDSVSFGANYYEAAKSLWEKIYDALNPKAAKLKKAALEAQRKAENEASALKLKQEKAEMQQKSVEEARILLGNWQARYAGLFQERKYVDHSGDIILCEKECDPELLAKADKLVRPDSWEYTLANFGINDGYFSKPLGNHPFYIKENGVYITNLRGKKYPNVDKEFTDYRWRLRYDRIQKTYGGESPCTVLSCGYETSFSTRMGRHPGVNFVIEGIIPLKDMQQIKKNIVEKGLWQNYIENQDQDAHIAIYNEIINYLNNIR